MRIVGVAVVRDEEDIVEASIRHNLRVLDAIQVVDHASTDATSAILAALAAEGLPVSVSRDDTLGSLPPEATAALVRRALEAGADLCVPIEADEFLRVPSREALERAVADAGPVGRLAIAVHTCAPDFASDGDIVARLRRAKRRSAEPPGSVRIAVTRRLLDPAASQAAATPALAEPVVAIASVPVRSAGQYVTKVAIGYLSRWLATPPVPEGANPYREAYAEILAGKAPARDQLATVALNFGMPAGHRVAPGAGSWTDVAVVGDVALRHTPAGPAAPLARVLAFGERVASEVARATGGL